MSVLTSFAIVRWASMENAPPSEAGTLAIDMSLSLVTAPPIRVPFPEGPPHYLTMSHGLLELRRRFVSFIIREPLPVGGLNRQLVAAFVFGVA